MGLEVDSFAGDVGTVSVRATVDGAFAFDETRPATDFPHEFDLAGRPGQVATIVAEVLNKAGSVMVTRRANVNLPPLSPEKKLIRLRLEERCFGTFPGTIIPIECDAPLTCVHGGCVSSDVPDADLEKYSADWSKHGDSSCADPVSPSAQAILGQGEEHFIELTDGDTVQLEEGPQGGHHIWLAARVKNIDPEGPTTALSARRVDDGSLVPASAYTYSFSPSAGSPCEVSGLRHQVDVGAADLHQAYKQFLGKELLVTLSVTDRHQVVVQTSKRVKVDTSIRCADGTTSCNTQP